MFSSFFGKRKSSPVEDEAAPIPGPKPDDGFVIVNPTSSNGGLYPNVSGMQFPHKPAPVIPVSKLNKIDQTFHYLQGVPFTMSRELQMSNNKDVYATEIGDLLAFLTKRINMTSYQYDFSLERSVVSEI